LVILAALTIGLAYILLKSFAFHETHITPGLSAKLFSLKMPSLIQSSYELYSQGVIWLSYLFLITIVAGIMSFFGLLYAYVFYTGLALVVFSTVLFIFDVETELGIKKNGESYYEEEDK
jgi:hypothetical protein